MASDISHAMIDHCSRDCLLIFLDALDALQGRDVDLEIVTSATLRPLRLVYSYNMYFSSQIIGLVFVQTHLGDLQCKTDKRSSPTELGELLQKDLMDPSALGITNVELLVDLSKSQIIDKFK